MKNFKTKLRNFSRLARDRARAHTGLLYTEASDLSVRSFHIFQKVGERSEIVARRGSRVMRLSFFKNERN